MIRRVLLILLVGALAVPAAAAYHAYRYERDSFRRLPGPVTRPADLSLLEVRLRPPSGEVRGWYAPSRNGAAVIFAHGMESDRRSLLSEARCLAHAGFGVLMLDLPGWGESAGRPAWGEPEVAALRAGVDWLAARPELDSTRIGGLGFSMGSAMMVLAGAADRRLRALALLGSFPTYESELRASYPRWGPLTGQAAIWGAQAAGAHPLALRPIDEIGRLAGRPLLFVVGDRDRTVPPALSAALYARAPEPKRLWVAHGAAHGAYAVADSAGYAAALSGFFTAALAK